MTLEEFKYWIADRKFHSTDNNIYKFISGKKLQVNDDITNSIHYSIYLDENGTFLLDHKRIIPTSIIEPVILNLNKQQNLKDPISFSVIGKISNEFFGTWIEK